MRRIGVLTSSRADYGIYYPLLKALQSREEYSLDLIVFGTHLSPYHGVTIRKIEEDGFEVRYKINSMLLHDDENSIATASALTSLKFADFWSAHSREFDLVFCLGDRYEMFGAVTAGIPFGIPFAHIHGGETTLGAIDNMYRHSISLASVLHFTSAEAYRRRVIELTGSESGVITTGALALDHQDSLNLYSPEEFREAWEIDMEIPTILMTIHPETVTPERNREHISVIEHFLQYLLPGKQVVVTMPNTDTNGSLFREMFHQVQQRFPDSLKLVENFGTRGYFSCMKLAMMVVGNSSSGIIEAASFGRYVLNLGDRQKGRISGENVVHRPFQIDEIKEAFDDLYKKGDYSGENLYFKGGATGKILTTLDEYFNRVTS